MIHIPVFVFIAVDRKDLVLVGFALLDLIFSAALIQEIGQELRQLQEIEEREF
jgi:hypothetical protein